MLEGCTIFVTALLNYKKWVVTAQLNFFHFYLQKIGLILYFSESGEARCPVDNSTVIREQLFPDNFAKREIQNFQVKCPRSKEGCTTVEILKQLPVSRDSFCF